MLGCKCKKSDTFRLKQLVRAILYGILGKRITTKIQTVTEFIINILMVKFSIIEMLCFDAVPYIYAHTGWLSVTFFMPDGQPTNEYNC